MNTTKIVYHFFNLILKIIILIIYNLYYVILIQFNELYILYTIYYYNIKLINVYYQSNHPYY